MTEKEYREHPAISRSELFKLSTCPEKFIYEKNNPIEATPALVFGQALHKAILQPEDFDNEFAIAPVCDRRTKEGKEAFALFQLGAEGKTIISAEDWEKIDAMTNKIITDRTASALLKGQHEVSYFWEDEITGEQCKCRVDSIGKVGKLNIIVDVKSANKADTETFSREALKYGYDVQTAMYSDGVKHNTGEDYIFIFIVIEKKPPYAINILQADAAFVSYGYERYRELMGIYHDCKESGNWYGYMGFANAPNVLSVPSWLDTATEEEQEDEENE